MQLTLDNAPIGARAPSVNGGHWERTKHGWKWLSGSTFPAVGGDWSGEIVLVCPVCESKIKKGNLVCCGIWHVPRK